MTLAPGQYARRDQLYQPGAYDSIPSAILCRKNLTATAKLVYAALAGHLLNCSADSVWPSIQRLADRIGSGRSAVKQALDVLAAAGFIDMEFRPGRSTRYRFSPLDTAGIRPPTGSKSDHLPGRNPTTSATDPAGIRPPPGQNPTTTGSKPNHETPKEELQEEPNTNRTSDSPSSSSRTTNGSPPTEGTPRELRVVPAIFADHLIRTLQVGRGDAGQLAADTTCFCRIADHLNRGDFGPFKTALGALNTAAAKIGQDRTIQKPAAAFMQHAKRLLAAQGCVFQPRGGTQAPRSAAEAEPADIDAGIIEVT